MLCSPFKSVRRLSLENNVAIDTAHEAIRDETVIVQNFSRT